MNKLLFIGGHHNSALATIDWLRENSSEFEYFWIGKKNVDSKNVSPEYTEVTAKDIPFYDLKAGKLFRTRSLLYIPQVIWNLILIPVGFFQAISYLRHLKPDLIVSFGGYLSVPVVLAGHLMKIRSVLHEQTATIGLANEISSKYADKILTTWPIDFYSDEKKSIQAKMEYTGLPIRNSIHISHEKINFPRQDQKTIYITGGKSGSLFINKTVIEIIDELSDEYNLIWSAGRRVGEADYSAATNAVNQLDESKRENIHLKEYFLESEIGKVFATSDFLITRGGAHTIYELALIKKPAIVIPIPWVSKNEQYKNGKILEQFGLARVLDQESLTPYTLLAAIEQFSQEIDNIKEVAKDKSFVPSNGQEKVGHAIIEIFNK
jgi:UDP-N-acetylglucosamine--N-acetylmuramyl-(pentapeptide) pyrophosphoryl-undecaprenol N-acetylglucosamine transferase